LLGLPFNFYTLPELLSIPEIVERSDSLS